MAMKEHKVKIGKKEFPLVFTLGTLETMEAEIPDFSLSEIDNILSKTGGLLIVLFLLAQEGAIAQGKSLDVDRKWFGAHIPASKSCIVEIQEAIVNTMLDYMEMETAEEDENQEVDVTLEELKKKE